MNKQQLQDNNTDLSRALSLIGDLPIKALVEAAASQGKYVWRKRISAGFGAIIYQWDDYDDSGIWYSADTYVIASTLTLQDLDGATMTSSALNGVFSYEDGVLYLVADGNKYACNDYTVGVNALYISSTTDYAPFVVSKPSTYEYVVSNNESAYPDGGTQDGYYYERVSGVTGIDFGKIALTTTQSEITVNHKLGSNPKYAILLGENLPKGAYTYGYVACFEGYIGEQSSGQGIKQVVIYGTSASPSQTTGLVTSDETQITFTATTAMMQYPFPIGIYNWIAIA